MSDNPIRPFHPDRPFGAAPRVVMVQSDDSRRWVVVLFSVALILGAGIGILGFLAGRRAELGKIHPPDLAAIPSVQAAKPPPPPLQIVPLPEGSLVREEPPVTPGSPVVIGFDGGQPISIVGNGATLEEKPAIQIRRHEPSRYGNPSAKIPLAPPVAPVPAAAPDLAAAPIPVVAAPETPTVPVSGPAAVDSDSPPDLEPDPALESSPAPPP
jgi:hypothetical protein